MDDQQRPAGHYVSHLTMHWADGTTTEKSWMEELTVEEATERMGPVPTRSVANTDALVAFLNRALDEEAETARVARRHWSMRQGEQDHPMYFEGRGDREAHIARQDPQATLDRVEATKALVALHHRIGVPVAPWGDDDELPACDVCWHWPEDFGAHPPRATDWPCPTLRALGSAYRRHPDYRTEWAPDGVGVDA